MRLRMEDRGCPTEWGDDDGTASHVYVDMYYLEGEKGVQTLRDDIAASSREGQLLSGRAAYTYYFVVM